MNKKQLYESIMKQVSIEVKKALNETNSTNINKFQHVEDCYNENFVDWFFEQDNAYEIFHHLYFNDAQYGQAELDLINLTYDFEDEYNISSDKLYNIEAESNCLQQVYALQSLKNRFPLFTF